MKEICFSLAGAVALLLTVGCASAPKGAEKGPDGTIAYTIEIEASEPGARIEVDGDYVGKAPTSVKVFGDRDGTFHNFGNQEYVIKAYPVKPGQQVQTKVFHTGRWFDTEDKIPKRLFFDFNLTNNGRFTIDLPKSSQSNPQPDSKP
ncbi:PEGA domain-containing protein [bacterium]|nr:PEGA domain-containing protein [bacterium]